MVSDNFLVWEKPTHLMSEGKYWEWYETVCFFSVYRYVHEQVTIVGN